jgi:hypothetical protein
MLQRLRYDIRPRYMERGCLAPMGYLIERRQHGRAIARREGPRTNIEWSRDSHMLSLDNQSITVAQFRQVIHGVIAQTQYQLDDLLSHWWPEIDLNLRDDLGNRWPGYSFVTDPQNHLHGKFRLLSQRVFAEDGGLSWTSPSQLLGYLRRCDRFVQYMFSAIHTTSGMPARGMELRSIRWANTLATPRNVVFFQGRLTLIFPYNKACNTTISRGAQVSPKVAACVGELLSDPPSSEIHNGSRQARSRTGYKRKLEQPSSPTAKRIRALQQELDRLVAERNSRTMI